VTNIPPNITHAKTVKVFIIVSIWSATFKVFLLY